MEDNLVALLSFVNEAEKYVNKNASENLGDLANIDLSKLKKQIAEHISSFDILENASSIETGQKAFGEYLENKVKKHNVIDELGEIFNVNFDDGIDDENIAKSVIDEVLTDREQTETEEETETLPNLDEVIETIREKTVLASDEKEPEPSLDKETAAVENAAKPETTKTIETKEAVKENIAVEDEDNNDADDEGIIEEIKKAYQSLEEETDDHKENSFGLSEDDEILNAIRNAASTVEAEPDETDHEEPVFQPAPDDLDSIFEEVETNKQEEEIPEPEIKEEPVEETVAEEEKPSAETEDAASKEETEAIERDILKSLSGLINYGQFDEKPAEEETEEASEELPEDEAYEPEDVHYIVNPLIDEIEELPEQESDPEETTSEEENEDAAAEADTENTEETETEDEDNNAYPADDNYLLHIIENPGLDVVFDGNDITYSVYDDAEENNATEETLPEYNPTEETYVTEKKTVQETEESPEVPQDLTAEPELFEEAVSEKTEAHDEPADENDAYVDKLLTDIDFGGNKVNEVLDARDETYRIISRMYPYLNFAFIRSAYDLKESIADEYADGEDIIILHRGAFKEIDDLRKYAELMMQHNYQVNVDENQMIVDSLRSYRNADGLILNSIFEVANQIALLNGVYEGYRVLTNEDR